MTSLSIIVTCIFVLHYGSEVVISFSGLANDRRQNSASILAVQPNDNIRWRTYITSRTCNAFNNARCVPRTRPGADLFLEVDANRLCAHIQRPRHSFSVNRDETTAYTRLSPIAIKTIAAMHIYLTVRRKVSRIEKRRRRTAG